MKNSKKIITLLLLALTFSMSAQVAPTTGEKVLEVKESHEGEYLQKISQQGFSDVVIKALTERVPKKLIKYGFTDISIIEVGQVPVPEGWATKLGSLTSNKSVGKGMLQQAKTYSEIEAAVNKMYQPEDTDGVDWKFQVNFIDNISKEEFKIRINMMSYNPLYIIKKSDLVKDLSKS
jgi:hypothetical protein